MDTALFSGSLVESDRILYTPSTFARTNLIHLQETGSLRALKPHTSRRENLSSYLCFIILEGSGTLEYNRESFALSAGDCVFLDCRKPYQHRCSEQLWRLKWAHFYGPNMAGIYEKYAERGGQPCFRPSGLAPYDAILTRLFETASSSDYVRDMKIFEQLTALLSLLMEDSWRPEGVPRRSQRRCNLQQVKDYLDLHYREPLRLDQLSDIFYINKFYLTRIFKEQFGLSITAYLLSLRITHAKRLLRFSGLSIEKIAQECGMQDANYFSRMFRKVEGVSPGEYRRQW
ncbi:MAG: helix-turn-helix domain-containing protein [Eubacteriales bacterium]|nr:helix-turn-helix domain-containing protein [Eubacteriales bacterium]